MDSIVQYSVQLVRRSCAVFTRNNIVSDDMMLGNYRAPNKCWLQGPYQLFGFIVPVGLLLLFNVIIFFLLMKRLLLRKYRVSAFDSNLCINTVNFMQEILVTR